MADAATGLIRLADLAAASGVPARTIRLYIARGLLDGPVRLGRGAAYGRQHLERLAQIRQLQAQGLTLQEIGHALSAAGDEGPGLPAPENWWRFVLADDVVVQVKASVAPWRRRLIRRALARLAQELANPSQQREANDHGGTT